MDKQDVEAQQVLTGLTMLFGGLFLLFIGVGILAMFIAVLFG